MVHGWRRTKSLLVSSSKIDFVSFVRWCGAKVNQLGWGFIELSKKVALSWPKFFQSLVGLLLSEYNCTVLCISGFYQMSLLKNTAIYHRQKFTAHVLVILMEQLSNTQ